MYNFTHEEVSSRKPLDVLSSSHVFDLNQHFSFSTRNRLLWTRVMTVRTFLTIDVNCLSKRSPVTRFLCFTYLSDQS